MVLGENVEFWGKECRYWENWSLSHGESYLLPVLKKEGKYSVNFSNFNNEFFGHKS